jgi:rhodanese-related sulfurtransferase
MAVKQLTPQQALEMANNGTLFVDVREKGETDAFSYDLKNVTYIPLSNFDKLFMAKLPLDKNTPIILACRSGGRSMNAAQFLESNGYSNLYNLNGGIMGWTEEGLPVKEA